MKTAVNVAVSHLCSVLHFGHVEFLGRIIAELRPIATGAARSMVCVSVTRMC